MDESAYRRVMSRNVNEFSLSQNSDKKSSSGSPDSPTNQKNVPKQSYSPNTTPTSTLYGNTITTGGMTRPHGHIGSVNTMNRGNYYSRSTSSDYGTDYSRKKSNLNLKQIKTVGLNCAKSITNKLINLSNSGSSSNTNNIYLANSSSNSANNKYSCSSKEVYIINSNTHSSSSANTNYPQSAYNAPGNMGNFSNCYGQPGDNRVYSLRCIADRISSTADPVKTHRELVAVIERCLTHSDYLIEITIEKDRFGAPTPESINNFTLINKTLLGKIIDYIKGRRDCCIFVVKFATWRMRTTKKPEEVILSLELISRCMNEMGGYFLGLFTKSLMKTLRKLLFATNLKHSITSGVKKKITKFLGKANYVHPGVSTDIRIHIFKSKILYLVQLYYETFLFEQGEYVVFYDGYKDMRIRGIKFPTINPQDKNQINTSYQFYSNTSGAQGSTPAYSHSNAYFKDLNIDLRELDVLLYNINNNNYDIAYIEEIRRKLLNSIEILSNKGDLDEREAMLLDKILKLNDSLLMLLSSPNKDRLQQSQHNVQSAGNTRNLEHGLHSQHGPHGHSTQHSSQFTSAESNFDFDENYDSNEQDKNLQMDRNKANVHDQRLVKRENKREDNLMDFGDSSIESRYNIGDSEEDFEFFENNNSNRDNRNKDKDNKDNSKDIKDNLDDIFNFISFSSMKQSNYESDNSSSNLASGKKESDLSDDEQLDDEDEDELINNFINSPNYSFNKSVSSNKDNNRKEYQLVNEVKESKLESENKDNRETEEKDKDDKPVEKREKNMSQLVSELDNLEVDFGHMSVNNF